MKHNATCAVSRSARRKPCVVNKALNVCNASASVAGASGIRKDKFADVTRGRSGAYYTARQEAGKRMQLPPTPELVWSIRGRQHHLSKTTIFSSPAIIRGIKTTPWIFCVAAPPHCNNNFMNLAEHSRLLHTRHTRIKKPWSILKQIPSRRPWIDTVS